MASVIDERGFNQSFVKTKTTEIRLNRRFDYMINQMLDTKEKDDINVLEIGCAEGYGLNYLISKTNFNGIGIDISTKFIKIARENNKLGNVTYEVVDFNDENTFTGEMRYNNFDYIIGNGILHHLYNNLDNSIDNLYKLLKIDGKIIFIEPNIYNPYVTLIFKVPFLRRLANLEPDEMAFSNLHIKDKIINSGFSNYKIEHKDFLLPIIPVFLVGLVIKIGDILEKTPFKYFSQSIFIVAQK
jgi:2-polyprenyl-3-methyl-5-hydroxy-6-metoxy-1,4-benzoquinol methylase